MDVFVSETKQKKSKGTHTKIVVLPAASKPIIKMRISFGGIILSIREETKEPIFVLG